ncbi:hypothetical protein PENTCL1PPCAC_2373, partial [Pristionchus entomophagus]
LFFPSSNIPSPFSSQMLLLLLFLSSPLVFSFDVPASHRLDPSIPTVSPHHENTTADSCIGQCAFKMIDEMSGQIGMNKTMELLKLNYMTSSVLSPMHHSSRISAGSTTISNIVHPNVRLDISIRCS